MLLLAVSDIVWQALIAGVVAVVLGWMQHRTKRSVEKGTEKATTAAEKAGEAATAAAGKAREVEDKLDANTKTTEAVDSKADVIVSQTDGVMKAVEVAVAHLDERVAKLEEYHHQTAHRVLDAINAMHLRLARMSGEVPGGAGADGGRE